MMKILSFLLLTIVLFSFGSAFLMSDQGNNVRLSNGTILALGNLTISIYDSSSGGNTIFTSNIEGAIVNGSWNLMINPDLQYGQFYWKDYEINGEDLDFDGNERLQFQSSSGLINNVSFLNFSMIGSCSSGSAIKLVYSNGSVECENVVSSGNSTVDLANYALKNQSETFAGNITTVQTGFFGWLGSLTSRITSLFVQDIDASRNIAVGGNITATYFLGDGSLLTNLPSAGAENDPIFVAENSTLWMVINSKLSSSDQRYNDTVLINSINSNANIRSLGFYNITEVNSLISGINGANSSFNQSLTDNLYYSINNPLSFVNTTSNETSLILNTNSTLWSYINSNQISWNSTFNSSYSQLLGSQCPIGYYVNGTLSNGTLTCLQSVLSESDPLWTANSTKVLYLSDLPLANRTLVHINNVTGFLFNYNQTAHANAYALSLNSSIISWVDLFFARVANVFNRTEIISQYYNKSDILSFGFVNSSSLSAYNDTVLINLVNQTLSSVKLTVTDQRYNETTLIISVNNTGNIQSLGFYNISQVNSLLLTAGNSSFNQTLTNSLYYSIINPNNFINHTQAVIYNDSLLILNTNSTLWSYILANSLSWNSTYNLTYNNLLGQQCPTGRFVNGTLSNGTIICGVDQIGASGNIFNQNLNTTSNVTFANVTASTGLFSFLGTTLSRIGNIFTNNIDASGNITSQFYIGSLNRSTFPISTCSGTDKVVGILFNGTVFCDTDETGGSSGNAGTNFINLLAGAVTDTNAPATERIVGNSYYLACVNATGYNSFRYGIARATTNGATNANVYIKYIDSPTTSITASAYTNLSTSGAQILSYTNQNTAKLSSSYTMNNTLDEICLGAFQAGGDGVLDPQWRNIWIELSS